jgi:murein DD-endopeptidase MepM/ murein hydrolase activator NlpD
MWTAQPPGLKDRSAGVARLLSQQRATGPRPELNSTEPLARIAASAASRAQTFAASHPRSLTTAVVFALAGFAATAFGIAPMLPDAADLPKRLVLEAVAPTDMQAQIDALAEHTLQLYRSDLTRASDTADSLLKRLNVADPAAAAILRTDPVARRLLEGRPGKMVRVETDARGALTELVARYAAADPDQVATNFTRLRVARSSAGFVTTIENAPLATQVKLGSGTVRSSLFAATDEARIPDNIATQLADVFSTDLDFHRQLHKGDTFSVLYEALTADGEPITWASVGGRVLAADYVNDGRTYSAVWYRGAAGKGAYYGFDGVSKKRGFLASPVEFSRVTSGFAMRLHPILNAWKQHKGVDYGAPAGTAVRSVGDGTVEFAGLQNGYGNVVEVRHANLRSTLYAHLSRIDVRPGQHIEQGQRLGAVGSTGWATGPHLHFEVKVGGAQQDPALLAKASESIALGAAARREFAQLANSVKGQLETASSFGRSGSYGE